MTYNYDARYGEILNHTTSGFELEKLVQELHITKDQVVKAILMEYKDQQPILCIIRVVDKLGTKNVKNLTGYKYSFMKEETLTNINLAPGAIPPFIGFELKIKTYIDKNLVKNQFYYGSGGSVYNACKFSVKEYENLGAEISNLTGEN